MAIDLSALTQFVTDNAGDAAAGVARSEIEEAVKSLLDEEINSFPRVVRFLSRIPRIGRRAGVTAIISTLKKRPDLFGKQNETYVKLANEAIEMFAESAGRAVADVTFDSASAAKLVENLNSKTADPATPDQPGSLKVRIHRRIAHHHGGECIELKELEREWAVSHPTKKVPVGGKGGGTRDVAGDPFPFIDLTLEAAIKQGAKPCGSCMSEFCVSGMEWAKPKESAKPASFTDGLNEDEQDAYTVLMVRARRDFGEDWYRLQRAKKGSNFDHRLMKRVVVRAAAELGTNDGVTDETFGRFVTIIDVDNDLSLKEEVVVHGRALARRAVREVGRLDMDDVRGFGRSVMQATRPVVEQIGIGTMVVFYAWLLTLLGGWTVIVAGSYAGNWKPVAAASFIVGLVSLLGTGFSSGVTWILNAARGVARAVGWNLPAERSLVWFSNLLLDTVPFATIFGFLTVAVILVGGKEATGTARLVVWIAAAAIVSKAAIYSRHGFNDLKVRDAKNTSQLLLKACSGLVVLALGLAMWQNWHPSVASTVTESSTVVITSTVRWAIIFGIGLIVGVATLGAGIKGDGGVPGIIRTLAGLLVLACVIGLMVVGIRRAIVGPDKVETPVAFQTSSAQIQIQPAPPMPTPPTASRTVKANQAPSANSGSTSTKAKSDQQKRATRCANPQTKILKDWCATH